MKGIGSGVGKIGSGVGMIGKGIVGLAGFGQDE